MTTNTAGPADPSRPTMSDLTEFLLARIAEDEQSWRTAYHPTNPMGIFLLAEVEAKRRIVEWDDKQYVDYGVLNILAAVYSDHPDYDPSWRPD